MTILIKGTWKDIFGHYTYQEARVQGAEEKDLRFAWNFFHKHYDVALHIAEGVGTRVYTWSCYNDWEKDLVTVYDYDGMGNYEKFKRLYPKLHTESIKQFTMG